MPGASRSSPWARTRPQGLTGHIRGALEVCTPERGPENPGLDSPWCPSEPALGSTASLDGAFSANCEQGKWQRTAFLDALKDWWPHAPPSNYSPTQGGDDAGRKKKDPLLPHTEETEELGVENKLGPLHREMPMEPLLVP